MFDESLCISAVAHRRPATWLFKRSPGIILVCHGGLLDDRTEDHCDVIGSSECNIIIIIINNIIIVIDIVFVVTVVIIIIIFVVLLGPCVWRACARRNVDNEITIVDDTRNGMHYFFFFFPPTHLRTYTLRYYIIINRVKSSL